ncbi:MAG TPA: GNAT family N-acetyltransferase [Longimicrobium sp.]|nr:GNAT family N-acetyltransferase [Longimicrobium sp.]
MADADARLTTRPSLESDREFAYAVKRAALGPYVAQTWGWDEAEQQAWHAADWQLRRPDIIVLDGEDVGTVQYVRRQRGYHLGEFYLLPAHQRRGIGSRLLRRMLDRADAEGVPVRLEVIRINPAKSLYERHGFRVYGETETHYQMERAPGTPAP